MKYARQIADALSELASDRTIEFTYTYVDEFGTSISEQKQISFATLLLWSDAERAAIGIYPIVDDVIPAGKIVTGSSLARVDATVQRHFTLEDAPPPPAPQSVTPLQMRKALRAAGLKVQADAYLQTLSDEVQEEWEYCIEVRRDNEFIAAAALALGQSVSETDDLFRLAKSFNE